MIHAVTDLRSGEKTTYTTITAKERNGIVVSYRDATEYIRFMYMLGLTSGLEEAVEILTGEPR